MTVYCRNGHRIVAPTWYDEDLRCPRCQMEPSRVIETDPTPMWPIALVVTVALVLVGAWWWWLWLAPR